MEHNEKLSNDLQIALHKEVLSFKEACSYLNLSPGWLYKLTHKNEIPFYKPNGKKIYFRKDELISWMTQKPVKSSEQIKREADKYISEKQSTKRKPFLKRIKEMKDDTNS